MMDLIIAFGTMFLGTTLGWFLRMGLAEAEHGKEMSVLRNKLHDLETAFYGIRKYRDELIAENEILKDWAKTVIGSCPIHDPRQ